MAAPIIESTQFPDTPRGWAELWTLEMGAAKRQVQKWHKRGQDIVKRYKDDRDVKFSGDTRLNLFTSNIQTMKAMLFGKIPNVDVDRRFADPNDDTARVAGEILQRLLNTDIQHNSDTFSTAMQNALEDRLLPGLGVARVRYTADFTEEEEVSAIMESECANCRQKGPTQIEEDDEEEEDKCPSCGGPMKPNGNELVAGYIKPPQKLHEDVETDYVYWRDFLWSPARVWDEVRWVAFKAQMSREDLVERFGEDIGNDVPLNSKTGMKSSDGDASKLDPWSRADVWEIWSKEHEEVFWWVDGFDKILDRKEDPLGLSNFFPCPRPLIANVTTSEFLPVPDFIISQDLYNEVDLISTRITLLERSVRVAGVYDRAAGGLKELVNNKAENIMVPVDNWAMMAEKGGLKGSIDWFPLDQVVNCLSQLRQYRTELIQLLYQVSGFSDIMRGAANPNQPSTATEQAIKAKFGSVRVQDFQQEFARFVSETQQLKSEVIARHFDDQTILQRSNIQYTADAQLAPEAIKTLKDEFFSYRVSVKPESVSMTDYAQLKQERVEVVQAIGQMVAQATPMIQMIPNGLPVVLELAKWVLASLKGSSQMEGIFDRAIEQVTQQPPQIQQPGQEKPQENPEAEQAKMQGQAQLIQMKTQADMAKTKGKLQADLAKMQAQSQATAQEQAVQARFNMEESMARMREKAMANVQRVTTPPGQPPQGG